MKGLIFALLVMTVVEAQREIDTMKPHRPEGRGNLPGGRGGKPTRPRPRERNGFDSTRREYRLGRKTVLINMHTKFTYDALGSKIRMYAKKIGLLDWLVDDVDRPEGRYYTYTFKMVGVDCSTVKDWLEWMVDSWDEIGPVHMTCMHRWPGPMIYKVIIDKDDITWINRPRNAPSDYWSS